MEWNGMGGVERKKEGKRYCFIRCGRVSRKNGTVLIIRSNDFVNYFFS